MNSLRYLYDRQVRYIVAAVVLLIATIAPSIAMAAQVTERSIALSSSTAGATGTSYNLKFTAIGGDDADETAGAFVLDFCQNSPLIGQACTAPVGMDADTLTTPTAGLTFSTPSANKVVGTLAGIAPDEDMDIVIAGITNPTDVGTFYARLLTFANTAAAEAYVSGTPGAYIDEGGFALSTTDNIGVSGAVLEALSFCVSSATIPADCAVTPGTEPTVALGDQVGDLTVLNPGELHTGSIYAQLSTNAAGGAIVNLKSNAANCGGLLRAGAPTACDIEPALGTNVDGTTNSGKFGVTVADATDVGAGAFGDFLRAPFYSASDYRFNFVDANSGVTSTYGDPILNTNNAPASNKQAQLTFGVAANNSTPAGLYSADLSLIATGKF